MGEIFEAVKGIKEWPPGKNITAADSLLVHALLESLRDVTSGEVAGRGSSWRKQELTWKWRREGDAGTRDGLGRTGQDKRQLMPGRGKRRNLGAVSRPKGQPWTGDGGRGTGHAVRAAPIHTYVHGKDFAPARVSHRRRSLHCEPRIPKPSPSGPAQSIIHCPPLH